MPQLPVSYHQAFVESNIALSTLSDLAISELFQNMSATIRMPEPPRARVAHACNHCRRLKTKCSGGQPECESCLRKGRVCHWTPLKTSKYRRSRKPYDSWIPYLPPIAPKVSDCPRVATPRPTYPSGPLSWSIQGTVLSLSQSNSMAPTPMPETMVQHAFTGYSPPTQYGWEGRNIHPQWTPSPPSTCPSISRSESSSSETTTPPQTPRTIQDTPTPRSPSLSPVKEASQVTHELDAEALLRELNQRVTPNWPIIDSYEFEAFFAQ
ncbi:hypothetical protein M405DRAFT_933393 [Rhizopogon salebrosus TDB-379]|nr:hypothetical protein M405DRAFT_933393 [Rhizopogon salebrosus TDB-379]